MRVCHWCTPLGYRPAELLQKYCDGSLSRDDDQAVEEDLGMCLECVDEYHRVRKESPQLHKRLWKLEKHRLLSLFSSVSRERQQYADDDDLYFVDVDGQQHKVPHAEYAHRVRIPLTEILKYRYLLGDPTLSEMCVDALCKLEESKDSFRVYGKRPGTYLLLVHPNETVRRWAIQAAKSLGTVDRDDFYDLQDILSLMFLVIERGISEIFWDCDNPTAPWSALPTHLYDPNTPKVYWLGICMLLNQLDAQAMDSLFHDSDKNVNILQCIINTLKKKPDDEVMKRNQDSFWPALQCFMVILECMGSRIWSQIDPRIVFRAVTESPCYNAEIQNLRSESSVKSEPVVVDDADDAEMVTCSQMVYDCKKTNKEKNTRPSHSVDNIVMSLMKSDLGQAMRMHNSIFLWFIPFVKSIMGLYSRMKISDYIYVIIDYLCEEINGDLHYSLSRTCDKVTEFLTLILVHVVEQHLGKGQMDSLYYCNGKWLEIVVTSATLPRQASQGMSALVSSTSSFRFATSGDVPQACMQLIHKLLKVVSQLSPSPRCSRFLNLINKHLRERTQKEWSLTMSERKELRMCLIKYLDQMASSPEMTVTLCPDPCNTRPISPPQTCSTTSRPEALCIYQPESLCIDQPEALRIDQPEALRVDQPEALRIDQPEALRVDQPESLCIDQPEALRVDHLEALLIDQPEALRIDQPEALRVDQPEALHIDQPEALRVDQPEALRIDQPEALHIDQPEALRIDQPEAQYSVKQKPLSHEEQSGFAQTDEPIQKKMHSTLEDDTDVRGDSRVTAELASCSSNPGKFKFNAARLKSGLVQLMAQNKSNKKSLKQSSGKVESKMQRPSSDERKTQASRSETESECADDLPPSVLKTRLMEPERHSPVPVFEERARADVIVISDTDDEDEETELEDESEKEDKWELLLELLLKRVKTANKPLEIDDADDYDGSIGEYQVFEVEAQQVVVSAWDNGRLENEPAETARKERRAVDESCLATQPITNADIKEACQQIDEECGVQKALPQGLRRAPVVKRRNLLVEPKPLPTKPQGKKALTKERQMKQVPIQAPESTIPPLKVDSKPQPNRSKNDAKPSTSTSWLSSPGTRTPAVVPPKKVHKVVELLSTAEKLGLKKKRRKAFDYSQRSLDSLDELRRYGQGVHVEPKNKSPRRSKKQMSLSQKRFLSAQQHQFYIQSRAKHTASGAGTPVHVQCTEPTDMEDMEVDFQHTQHDTVDMDISCSQMPLEGENELSDWTNPVEANEKQGFKRTEPSTRANFAQGDNHLFFKPGMSQMTRKKAKPSTTKIYATSSSRSDSLVEEMAKTTDSAGISRPTRPAVPMRRPGAPQPSTGPPQTLSHLMLPTKPQLQWTLVTP